jgi:AraC family transcriptional regulator
MTGEPGCLQQWKNGARGTPYTEFVAFFGAAVASAEWQCARVSETRFARGAYLPMHRHDDAYLTFVLGGAYREHAKAGTRLCGARTMVVHPEGDAHENEFAQKPTRCLNAVLSPSFLRRLGPAASSLGRANVYADASLALIGDRLSGELRTADASSPIIIEGLLLEVLGLLARSETPLGKTPAWLVEAHAILGRTFAGKPSLGTLAEEVGVHPVHLARAFRRKYGVSVGDHVRALRVAYARERITAGESLAVVATEAGFADQSHFARTFKRSFGVSPSEYRRRH